MSAFSHYIDVMLREGGIAHDLHARLLLAAHFRIAAGDKLAVAWPDWRDHQPGEFGLLCRVFGVPDALASYGELIAPLGHAQLVRTFPVQAVPDTPSQISFVRNRRQDKFSPSAAARLTRRAEARGETWKGPSRCPPDPEIAHFLSIPSTSAQRTFRLYVSRVTGSQEARGGEAYGLGMVIPNF